MGPAACPGAQGSFSSSSPAASSAAGRRPRLRWGDQHRHMQRRLTEPGAAAAVDDSALAALLTTVSAAAAVSDAFLDIVPFSGDAATCRRLVASTGVALGFAVPPEALQRLDPAVVRPIVQQLVGVAMQALSATCVEFPCSPNSPCGVVQAAVLRPGTWVAFLSKALVALEACGGPADAPWQDVRGDLLWLALQVFILPDMRQEAGQLAANKDLALRLLRQATSWHAHMMNNACLERHEARDAFQAVLDLEEQPALYPLFRQVLGEEEDGIGGPAGTSRGGTLVHSTIAALRRMQRPWRSAQRAAQRAAAAAGAPAPTPTEDDEPEDLAGIAQLARQLLHLAVDLPCTMKQLEGPAGRVLGQHEDNVVAWEVGPDDMLGLYEREWSSDDQQQAARRTAAPFFEALNAAADALHDLLDRGGVAGLEASFGETELGMSGAQFACAAVAELALVSTDFTMYARHSMDWAPANVAAACTASEAVLRLILKLGPERGPGRAQRPLTVHAALLHSARAWLGVLFVLASGDTQTAPQPNLAINPAVAAEALGPAMRAAASAAKMVHAVRAMTAVQRMDLFGKYGEEPPLRECCKILAMTASLAWDLLSLRGEEAGPLPEEAQRQAEGLIVTVLGAALLLLQQQGEPGAQGLDLETAVELAKAALLPSSRAPGVPHAAELVAAAGGGAVAEAVLRLVMATGPLSSLVGCVSDLCLLLREAEWVCVQVSGSGVLGDLARWIASMLELGQRVDGDFLFCCNFLVDCCCLAVASAAGKDVGWPASAAGGSSEAGSDADLATGAMAALMESLERNSGTLLPQEQIAGGPGRDTTLSRAAHWQGLSEGMLALAEGVARATLVAVEERQGEERRLLVARACAARACAYLGCTDMRGSSEGSKPGKRCSKCRACAYCGPRDQRADWAQHRLVCAQLAGAAGQQ